MKRALVLGSARSGHGVVRLLLKQGYHVLWADDKPFEVDDDIDLSHVEIMPSPMPIQLVKEKVDIVVKNPGIPDNHLIVSTIARRMFIYNEVDIAYLYAKKQFNFGAISGTNGKTTTTSLLSHLLQGEKIPAYAAGNIGLPLSQVAFDHGDKPANIALELSSFQCDGLLFFKPKVYAILNLSPDHLDRYPNVEAYYDSKFRVLKNMNQNDYFLRNIDDVEVMKRSHFINCQVIDFSLKQKADIYLEENSVYYQSEVLFNLSDSPLIGAHNIQNAMVACMIAKLMGVESNKMIERLKTFKAVDHRLQQVSLSNGIRFINDSKATNIDATLTAINSMNTPTIILLGGYDKKISYEPLKDELAKLKGVVAFGETASQIKEIFEATKVVETLDEAFQLALSQLAPGDTLLFSPASASFDQYPNFEVRGDHFVSLVHQFESNNN